MENLLVQAFGAIGVGMSLATIEETAGEHPLLILADVITGVSFYAPFADRPAFD